MSMRGIATFRLVPYIRRSQLNNLSFTNDPLDKESSDLMEEEESLESDVCIAKGSSKNTGLLNKIVQKKGKLCSIVNT